MSEKCRCGKPKHHRGRCPGLPRASENFPDSETAKAKVREGLKKSIRNSTRTDKYDEILTDIESKIVQLQAMKTALLNLIDQGVLG